MTMTAITTSAHQASPAPTSSPNADAVSRCSAEAAHQSIDALPQWKMSDPSALRQCRQCGLPFPRDIMFGFYCERCREVRVTIMVYCMAETLNLPSTYRDGPVDARRKAQQALWLYSVGDNVS